MQGLANYFCLALRAKNDLHFFEWLKKKKKNIRIYFVTHESYIKFKFP